MSPWQQGSNSSARNTRKCISKSTSPVFFLSPFPEGLFPPSVCVFRGLGLVHLPTFSAATSPCTPDDAHTCASSPLIPDLSPAFRSSPRQFIVSLSVSRIWEFWEPHQSAKHTHLLLTAKLICPATCWILWFFTNGWKEALLPPCYYLSPSIKPFLMIAFLSSYLSENNGYFTT